MANWAKEAIKRPGQLGAKGFLSLPLSRQKMILRGCVKQYGYRSCLGSILFLERMPGPRERFGDRLAQLRHYLVKTFGSKRARDRMRHEYGYAIANPARTFILIPVIVGSPQEYEIITDDLMERLLGDANA